MNRLYEMMLQEEDDAVIRNLQRALVMHAASSHIQRIQHEESQWGGSRDRRAYIPRDREEMDHRLKALYFNPICRFQGDIFRRRFRMKYLLFDRMMHDVANHDPYFIQTLDASNRVSLSTEQKLTCAMRMLAYALPSDLIDEFLDIAESTSMEILRHFTRAMNVYHQEYLRRPTKANLQRLLNVADKRGFPEMVGSLDCMHWQWKNCPTSWQGYFIGYKGKPTIVLKVAASHDIWILHAYFGFPGSLNDINVIGMSPLFDNIYQGESPRVKYHVNDRQYGQCYYLVDGIYPKWGCFVKAIKTPVMPQQAHFTKKQESYRKDVERAFGILQARFAIVKNPARGWSGDDLQYIMMTCIILHNMIVEDEREEDEALEGDPEDVPTRPRKEQIYDISNDDHEVERNPNLLGDFMRGYEEVRCHVLHRSLQGDLVDHLWNVKMQANRSRHN